MKWQFELSDTPTNIDYPVVARQVYSNGIVKGPFYLSIDSMLATFAEEPEEPMASELEQLDFVAPVLPYGTVRYAANASNSRQIIVMEIPKKQWEIRYGDNMDMFYTVGFPRLVVQYTLSQTATSNLNIEQTRIFAVEERHAITEDTPLFTFPYPNVGKTNGIVCWGRNTKMSITDVTELERMFRWFIAAPFNEDHGVSTTLGISNFRRLLEIVQNKPFDDEWLMPANMAFGELLTTRL